MATRSNNPLGFLGRYWFPIALVALFLLALPGMALFVTTLVGQESSVNRWLQDNWNLTYGIKVPWYAALILLLLPFLILLLYFLKLKRKPLQVPSTFLWRKSIEDLHVNSLLQWLRQNVLLLLQLLIVIVLIYGVMDFRFHGRTGNGKHYILMIDNSASMSATDVAPSRLEWAKQEALKEIDAAGDDDFGIVIEFNSEATTLQSKTNDRELLRTAVRGIKPTERPTSIMDALRLAASQANLIRSTENEASRPEGELPGLERRYDEATGTPTEAHLYSDGRFPDVDDFKLGNLQMTYHPAGQPGAADVRNVGIVNCNARRDENDATRIAVFVGINNYCPFDVTTRVELEVTVNGQSELHPDQTRTIPARAYRRETSPDSETPVVVDAPGEERVVFQLKDLDESADVLLRVRIIQMKDDKGQPVNDVFPLDDEARLVVGVVRKARVLIVGKPSEALKAFFDADATRAVAKADYMAPADLDTEKYRQPALNGGYDLVIFDRCGPATEKDMPRANTFFIGFPPPPWKLPEGDAKEGVKTEKLMNPHIKGWDQRNAIMRYLRALDRIGIAEGFKMKDLPPRTPRLIESGNDTALLLTLGRQSFTDLVLTFPIFNAEDKWNTDWPARFTSFPIFLTNMLYVLGSVGDAASEENTLPGRPKVLRPDISVDKIQVIPPGGKPVPLTRGTRPDFTFNDTERVGIYQVAWDGAVQRRFAVNLLDSEESNLQPREEFKIGTDEVKAAGPTPGQPMELWKWVVLAALVLLVLEWYIYNRRVYI